MDFEDDVERPGRVEITIGTEAGMRQDTGYFSMRAMSVFLACAMCLALGALAVFAQQAQAGERVCRGTIGPKTLDNVKVPSGATCKLNGTTVKGNVNVHGGARLYASSIRVNGNVQGEGFKVVVVKERSKVGGNVQLKLGRSGGTGNVVGTRIDGDLQYEENRARMVARSNTVLGNLQVFKNRGGVVLKSNRVSQSLQCGENRPAPTGGGNQAGDKEGQCARL